MAFRKIGLTWIVLLLSVTLSGCISRWTEDVELGDGTIIKVTRTEKYGGGWCGARLISHANKVQLLIS